MWRKLALLLLFTGLSKSENPKLKVFSRCYDPLVDLTCIGVKDNVTTTDTNDESGCIFKYNCDVLIQVFRMVEDEEVFNWLLYAMKKPEELNLIHLSFYDGYKNGPPRKPLRRGDTILELLDLPFEANNGEHRDDPWPWDPNFDMSYDDNLNCSVKVIRRDKKTNRTIWEPILDLHESSSVFAPTMAHENVTDQKTGTNYSLCMFQSGLLIPPDNPNDEPLDLLSHLTFYLDHKIRSISNVTGNTSQWRTANHINRSPSFRLWYPRGRNGKSKSKATTKGEERVETTTISSEKVILTSQGNNETSSNVSSELTSTASTTILPLLSTTSTKGSEAPTTVKGGLVDDDDDDDHREEKVKQGKGNDDERGKGSERLKSKVRVESSGIESITNGTMHLTNQTAEFASGASVKNETTQQTNVTGNNTFISPVEVLTSTGNKNESLEMSGAVKKKENVTLLNVNHPDDLAVPPVNASANENNSTAPSQLTPPPVQEANDTTTSTQVYSTDKPDGETTYDPEDYYDPDIDYPYDQEPPTAKKVETPEPAPSSTTQPDEDEENELPNDRTSKLSESERINETEEVNNVMSSIFWSTVGLLICSAIVIVATYACRQSSQKKSVSIALAGGKHASSSYSVATASSTLH